MEDNTPEIVLLACGILALVALMSSILWLGHRKRYQERRDSQESQSYNNHTQGRECLFKEVFADHPDHDPPLIRLYDNDRPSFITTVRKRSQTIAGAVQQELRELRRDLKFESLAGGSQSPLDEESEVGLLADSSTEEEIVQHHSNTGADGRHGRDARRRTSSSVKLQRLKPRKSQEGPLMYREKG